MFMLKKPTKPSVFPIASLPDKLSNSFFTDEMEKFYSERLKIH